MIATPKNHGTSTHRQKLTPDAINKIPALAEQLRDALKNEGVDAGDPEVLAKALVDHLPKDFATADRSWAEQTIHKYILSHPNILLTTAALCTVTGNAMFAANFFDAAGNKPPGLLKTLDLINAIIFCSFTAEKASDFLKTPVEASLRYMAGSADAKRTPRRQFFGDTATWINHNYHVLAPGWLAANQFSSAAGYGALTLTTRNAGDAATSATRVGAGFAAAAMAIYSYRALLREEEMTGGKLVDEKIRRLIEPANKAFGETIDELGSAVPLFATVALAAPYACLGAKEVVEKQKVPVDAAITIAGIAAFVGYLSSEKRDEKENRSSQAEHMGVYEHTKHIQQEFHGIGEEFLTHDPAKPISKDRLIAMFSDFMGMGNKASGQLAEHVLERTPHTIQLMPLMEILAEEIAGQHAARIARSFPGAIDRDTLKYIEQQLTATMLDGIEEKRGTMEKINIVIDVPKTRRSLLKSRFFPGGRQAGDEIESMR